MFNSEDAPCSSSLSLRGGGGPGGGAGGFRFLVPWGAPAPGNALQPQSSNSKNERNAQQNPTTQRTAPVVLFSSLKIYWKFCCRTYKRFRGWQKKGDFAPKSGRKANVTPSSDFVAPDSPCMFLEDPMNWFLRGKGHSRRQRHVRRQRNL